MSYIGSIIAVLVIVLVSMILHELAHGLVAYWLGDDTAKMEGRLTLNPLKHLDPILSVAMPLLLFLGGGPVFGGAKPVPINTRNLKFGAWGMALVAIAGPLTNLLLAFGAFLVLYFTGGLVDGNYTLFWNEVLLQFVGINLGFAVFNLIPIPPLDGSRVLYAIAPDGVRTIMERIEPWGIIVVMMVVVILPGFVSNIMLGAMQGIMDIFYFLVGMR